MNFVDLRVERNFWKKIHEWHLREKKKNSSYNASSGKWKKKQCKFSIVQFVQMKHASWLIYMIRHPLKCMERVAQGSCHGSTVSPRVMSLSFDDDENSYIKSWLDQNRRPGDLKVNFAECCGNCRKKHCYLKRSSTSDCTK